MQLSAVPIFDLKGASVNDILNLPVSCEDHRAVNLKMTFDNLKNNFVNSARMKQEG